MPAALRTGYPFGDESKPEMHRYQPKLVTEAQR